MNIPGILIFFLAVCVSFGLASSSEIDRPAIPVYQQLTKWKFSKQPIPVPPEGITFSRENATWKLIKGHIRLMEPTPDGKVTGLIFEGSGRFRMSIPHWVEQDHLRRCSGKKDQGDLDEEFNTMVLRTPEPLIESLAVTPPNLLYVKNSLAANRHEIWVKRGWTDVDARIVSGLFNPGDRYLRVAMDTKSFGWLSYVFDKYSQEEIQLIKYRRKYDFEEIWVSLDRKSHRKPSGVPGTVLQSAIDIQRLDIEANLTGLKIRTLRAYGPSELKTAGFNAAVTFVPLESGHRMIWLSLGPSARIKSVRSGTGQALPFLRHRSGIKVLTKKDRTYVDTFYVLLNKPLIKGEERKISILYDLDISNFVSGGQWYPRLKETLNDRHMVFLTAR